MTIRPRLLIRFDKVAGNGWRYRAWVYWLWRDWLVIVGVVPNVRRSKAAQADLEQRYREASGNGHHPDWRGGSEAG